MEGGLGPCGMELRGVVLVQKSSGLAVDEGVAGMSEVLKLLI